MICVKQSAIHGRGLFATMLIPEGTVIGKLEGEITTEDGPHVLWLDETRGMRVTNDLKFINHAAEPNAAYFDDLTVGALRDIKPGEEITHNYLGDDEEDEDGPAVHDFDLHDDLEPMDSSEPVGQP